MLKRLNCSDYAIESVNFFLVKASHFLHIIEISHSFLTSLFFHLVSMFDFPSFHVSFYLVSFFPLVSTYLFVYILFMLMKLLLTSLIIFRKLNSYLNSFTQKSYIANIHTIRTNDINRFVVFLYYDICDVYFCKDGGTFMKGFNDSI